MATKKTKGTFEKNITELETIVTNMENGVFSLEESLTAFEKGVKMAHQCQTILNEAEQKVQILTTKYFSNMDAEQLHTEPFDINPSQDNPR